MKPPARIKNKTEQILTGKDDTRSLRIFIANQKEEIKKAHIDGESGLRTVRAYSKFVDKVIEEIYRVSTKNFEEQFPGGRKSKCVVIAVGGYGREELNPHSDVDILVLYEPSLDKYIDTLAKDIVTLLWDTGFKVGHSLRTVKESMKIGSQDFTAQTAMTESRYIIGDKELYEKFGKALKKNSISKGIDIYIKHKMDERKRRHSMYDESINLLEPNIKESPGGLRDFHITMWAAATKYGIKNLEGLYEEKLISKRDLKTLMKSYDFLLKVRTGLHLLVDRKTDALDIEIQKKIAYNLGYRNKNNRKLVEIFMQDYYINATNIYRFSMMFLDKCLEKKKSKSKKVVVLDNDFIARNGEIDVNNCRYNIFRKNPVLLLKIFCHIQKLGLEISAETRDAIISHLKCINNDFRVSKEASETFLSILKNNNAGKTLRLMSDIGVLGRFIPEFDTIRCLVQYDIYHKYTVDEHTLKSIEVLEGLAKTKNKELKKLSELYKELHNPEILKLALLFHDIGKGGGEGHVRRGVHMAASAMKRMGLPEEVSDRIKMLIDNHLVMSHLSQRRDMHDDKVIGKFVSGIREEEILKMLYILTYADMKSVGTDVWTGWKAALLMELFDRALYHLTRGDDVTETSLMNKLEEEILEKSSPDINEKAIKNFLEIMPNKYTATTSAEKIVTHLQLMEQLQSKKLIVDYHHNLDAGYTELIVCTEGKRGLFSLIAGTLTSKNINILGAQIFTSRYGVAIDTLQVNDLKGRSVTDKKIWKDFEKDLLGVIEGEESVEKLIKSRKRYVFPHKTKGPKIETEVRIKNNISDTHTVIEIITEDRIGLLYDITGVLFMLGHDIYVAKISTQANKVIDVFYVTDSKEKKIFHWKKLREIEYELKRKLSAW